MRKSIIPIIAMLLGIAVTAQGQSPFYGEWVVKSSGKLIQKVWDNGSVIRVESYEKLKEGEQPGIVLMFKDSICVLQPAAKSYGCLTGKAMRDKQDELFGFDLETISYTSGYEFIKTEVISGVECKHYYYKQQDVTRSSVDGRTVGVSEGGYGYDIWLSSKMRLPVQKENIFTFEGSRIERMVNIQFGAQPAHLFVVPEGWKRIDMGAMLEGMNQMMKDRNRQMIQATDDLKKLEKGEKSSNEELNQMMEGFKALEQMINNKKK